MKHRDLTSSLRERHTLLAEGVVEVALERPEQLLDANGRAESGLDEVAGVLFSARQLPRTVVVRVLLSNPTRELEVEAEFRAACAARAAMAWREALGIRRNGRRDLWPAVVTATAFGVVASAAGALAASRETTDLLAVIAYVVSGITVIAAWASAWLPIEQVLFDWRSSAHLARTYDLLAGAPLELASTDEAGAPSPDDRPAASSGTFVIA